MSIDVEPILQVSALCKRFGSIKAVDQVSFDVPAGEVLCLIGANGAGKSTLLLLLGGVIYADSGTIRVFGRDRWAENLEIRRQTTFALAETLAGNTPTPREYLRFIGQIYGLAQERFEARLEQLAGEMEFTPHLDKAWEQLSLGMAKKAMLIGAFLPEARLRLLDEPFAGGIDPRGMEMLFTWFAAARERGETILFSTQVLDQAETISDRLMILQHGTSHYLGTPEELIRSAGLDPATPRALTRAFLKLTEQPGAEAGR